MPSKTLQVQVEFDIQAVTCPGVWLCPSGNISLHIFLLDSCVQTTGLQPIFPLLYHEKFIFYKTFNDAHKLSDLQRLINKDFLYAELIQWQNCDIGNVLATFQTSLGDVLYPSGCEGSISGVDVDLLMEPSKNYPGIIAPKIEISTRTTIEEILCASNSKKNNSFVINHKTLPSDQYPSRLKRNQLHQQKVCHSLGYHKARRCTRTSRSNKPPFVCRKAEEDLLGRKPQGLESGSPDKCKCFRAQTTNYLCDKKIDLSSMHSPSEKTYTRLTNEFLNKYPQPIKIKPKCTQRGRHSKRMQLCSCGRGHIQDYCTVCSKYRCYFEDPCSTPRKAVAGNRSPVRNSYVQEVTRSPTREGYRQSGRSPFTLGQHHHKSRPCACSPPRAAKDFPQEAKMSEYTSTCNDDKFSKRMCFCSPQRKPSLAEKLHDRLKQTLNCAPSYPFGSCHSVCDSPIECSCANFENCRAGFYKHLGKFYRDLRTC